MASKTVPFAVGPCGKRGFSDEEDAEKALGRAQSKRRRAADKSGTRRGMDVENRVLYCSDCDLYHLTGMSRREYNSNRQRMAA